MAGTAIPGSSPLGETCFAINVVKGSKPSRAVLRPPAVRWLHLPATPPATTNSEKWCRSHYYGFPFGSDSVSPTVKNKIEGGGYFGSRPPEV